MYSAMQSDRNAFVVMLISISLTGRARILDQIYKKKICSDFYDDKILFIYNKKIQN